MTNRVDLPATIESVATVLAECGIRHAFGGAIAQNYWGTVRATQDVDLLALVPALKTQAVVDGLTRRGFCLRNAAGAESPITVAVVVESWRRDGLLTVWLGITKVEIFSPVIPLQNRILDRAVAMPWHDRTIPITSAEDLILLKMVFHREKDLRDIRGIVVARGDRLDRAYLREQSLTVLDETRRRELQDLLGAAG